MAPALSKFITKQNVAGAFALSALIWLLKRKSTKKTIKSR